MRFVSLMNTRRFSPTLEQLNQLTSTTKSIIGVERVSALLLTEVQPNAGLAILIHNGMRYDAAKLLSNGRWYLTGDYTFA